MQAQRLCGRQWTTAVALAALLFFVGSAQGSAADANVGKPELAIAVHVGFSATEPWPQAFVVASREGSAVNVELSMCDSQLSCVRHTATLAADALVDHGGMNRPISLVGHIDGVGDVALRFSSVQLGNQALVGCSSALGDVSVVGDDAEAGAASGTVGSRTVRSVCAVGARGSVLAYAFTPSP